MPLKGEYTWTEKKDQLKISIRLKGVAPSKVDIFVTSSILKVNYSPYLLEVLLLKEVDPVKHKASVSYGTLNITLLKKEQELWGKCEISLDEYERDQKKKELLTRKQDALKERTEIEAKLSSQQSDRKVTEERNAVRQQMALDEAERNLLEQLKADEKKSAEEDVYRALSQFAAENEKKPTQKVVPASEKKETSKKGSKELIHDNIIEEYDMIDDREEDEMLSPKKTSPVSAVVENSKKPPTKSTTIDKKITVIDEIDEDEEDEQPEVDELAEEEEEEESPVRDDEEELKYIPAPRQFLDVHGNTIQENAKFKINFTPRLFPTPSRESKAAEEEDWIAKNRRHLKKHAVLGKTLANNKNGNSNANDVSEEDPVWLKAKGDDFFRSGDYRSALNAYSAAIDSYDLEAEEKQNSSFGLNENLLACYSNRSLCYLKLQLSKDCKLDCEIVLKNYLKQLDAITAEVTDTANQASHDNNNNNNNKDAAAADPKLIQKNKIVLNYIKLLLRHGLVSCQLGQYHESLSNYSTALVKIQQCSMYALEILTNQYHITIESITKDIDKLKSIITAESSKKQGDLYFSEKQIDKAISCYTEALSMIPIYVSALSNRSACYLIQKDYEHCLSDCNLALDILQLKEDSSASSSYFQLIRTMLHAIVPLPQSEKHIQWMINISLKKSVAFIQMNQLKEAIEIYEQSILPLENSNPIYLKDLQKLRERYQQEQLQQEGPERELAAGQEEIIPEKSKENQENQVTSVEEVAEEPAKPAESIWKSALANKMNSIAAASAPAPASPAAHKVTNLDEIDD